MTIRGEPFGETGRAWTVDGAAAVLVAGGGCGNRTGGGAIAARFGCTTGGGGAWNGFLLFMSAPHDSRGRTPYKILPSRRR